MPKPASIYAAFDDEGSLEYKNQLTKKLHNLQGPALLYKDGTHYWYKDGLLHREDGPAIYLHPEAPILAEDKEEWKSLRKKYKEYLQRVYENKEKPKTTSFIISTESDPFNAAWFEQEVWYYEGKIHREGGPAVIGHRKKEWHYEGLPHREDGPAVEYDNGSEEWYKDGIIHRLDGPAILHKGDQREEWYKEGLLHRLDGPAKTYWDERNHRLVKQYYIDDTLYNKKEEYDKEVQKRKDSWRRLRNLPTN